MVIPIPTVLHSSIARPIHKRQPPWWVWENVTGSLEKTLKAISYLVASVLVYMHFSIVVGYIIWWLLCEIQNALFSYWLWTKLFVSYIPSYSLEGIFINRCIWFWKVCAPILDLSPVCLVICIFRLLLVFFFWWLPKQYFSCQMLLLNLRKIQNAFFILSLNYTFFYHAYPLTALNVFSWTDAFVFRKCMTKFRVLTVTTVF